MTLEQARIRCEAFMVRHGASAARAHQLWLERPFTLEPIPAGKPIDDALWAQIEAHFRAIVKRQPSPAEVTR